MRYILNFVIKIAHIDCEKNIYNILNSSYAKPLNHGLKNMMNYNKSLIFELDEIDKFEVSYQNDSNRIDNLYFNFKLIPTTILISGDLDFLRQW